jgi:hypothetical protein
MKNNNKKICNLSNLQTQTQNTPVENRKCPRVMNTTDIYFIQEEVQLLNKGLKYNLCYKQKNWLDTLVLEAEP